jgi:hypothetical protein
MEHWSVIDSRLGIVITCRGHDKQRRAAAAVTHFRRLALARTGSYTVIADLREMTGYESVSRQLWQEAFRAERLRIQRLVLVGAQSTFIRMGASVVGAFAGVPVRFVDSWADVAKSEP